jgi:SAM-dependent methyltransferase
MNTTHLDIGCGGQPRNPYNQSKIYGLDQAKDFQSENIRPCHLGIEPIPFDNDFFDSISAYDLLEHIPRTSINHDKALTTFPFIYLMSEIYRTLKPNGVFFALTPAFPSKQAFQDPTHVNFITEDTHSYFCGEQSILARYGFSGQFKQKTVKRVFPEEAYQNNKNSLRIKKIRYKILRRPISHLMWELIAIKEQL